MDELKNLSPSRILHHIIHNRRFNIDTYTFIIAGKIGPTGKSWLRHELYMRGYAAIEITNNLYPLVDYHDDDNHVMVDEEHHTVLIVLNRRLPMGQFL
jgi:hypothetical protein